jgi:hypothetical protein
VTRRRAIPIAVLLVTAQSCAMAWATDAGAARQGRRTVVTLQTIPGLAGVRIVQAGRIWRTDENGRVRMAVRRHRGGRLSAEGFPFATPRVLSKKVRPGVVASFSRFRWHGWPKRVQVGLSLSYRVRLAFADGSGEPIDPRRIERIVIKSHAGSRAIRKGVDTLQLQGSRVGPYGRHGGLASKSIGYSVREVVIDGSNVVNRGEVRFYPFRTRVVPIELLFFDLDIASRDALFDTRIGSRVEVIGPDGRTRRVALSAEGRVHLDRLPRGRYRVRTDATGLGASRLVTLSRHQVVEVEVFSVVDLLLLGGAGSGLAIGLVLVRRPRLRTRVARRVVRVLGLRPRPVR